MIFSILLANCSPIVMHRMLRTIVAYESANNESEHHAIFYSLNKPMNAGRWTDNIAAI
jgi:hypothetical protein